MEDGEIGILNVGAGDTKISFDKSKPAERKRAAKIVKDMIERGYAIMVQVGEKDGKPLYQRAESFDPETCDYIVMGVPDEPKPAAAAGERPRRAKVQPVRVDAATTRAVSVARSAGG